MIVDFDFMAFTPDGKTWNIESINFFGDRIELDLISMIETLDINFPEKRSCIIYYNESNHRKVQCVLYRKHEGEWKAVNKVRKNFDIIFEGI